MKSTSTFDAQYTLRLDVPRIEDITLGESYSGDSGLFVRATSCTSYRDAARRLRDLIYQLEQELNSLEERLEKQRLKEEGAS